MERQLARDDPDFAAEMEGATAAHGSVGGQGVSRQSSLAQSHQLFRHQRVSPLSRQSSAAYGRQSREHFPARAPPGATTAVQPGLQAAAEVVAADQSEAVAPGGPAPLLGSQLPVPSRGLPSPQSQCSGPLRMFSPVTCEGWTPAAMQRQPSAEAHLQRPLPPLQSQLHSVRSCSGNPHADGPPCSQQNRSPEDSRVRVAPFTPRSSSHAAPLPQMPQSRMPTSEGCSAGGEGSVPARCDMQQAAPSRPTISGSSPAPDAFAVPVVTFSSTVLEPALVPAAAAAASASCSSAIAEAPARPFSDGSAPASAPVSADLSSGSSLGSSDGMQSDSDCEAKGDKLPPREACRLQPAGGLPGSISIHRRASQISGSRQESSQQQHPQQLQAPRLPGVLFQASGRSGGIAAAVQRRHSPGTAEPRDAATASEPAALNSGVPPHLPLLAPAVDAELPMDPRAEGDSQAAQASTGTAASCGAAGGGLRDESAAAHSRGIPYAGRTTRVRRVCRALVAAVKGKTTEGPEADGGLRSPPAPHV